jgi:hypothetical protein
LIGPELPRVLRRAVAGRRGESVGQMIVPPKFGSRRARWACEFTSWCKCPPGREPRRRPVRAAYRPFDALTFNYLYRGHYRHRDAGPIGAGRSHELPVGIGSGVNGVMQPGTLRKNSRQR